MALRLKAVRLLEPPPRIPPGVWLEEHVTMPPGTETAGQPFSLSSFPHSAGPLEAFHNPAIRRVVLCWGTRLGKTTLGLSLFAFVAGTNPRNMMLSAPTKDAAVRVISGRLYPILESTDGVRQQLPPPHRRNVLLVKLRACRVYVGWSGSESSLADVGAYFGIGNEIDKWDADTSTEADPLALFINRFKGFTDHKILLESTPTIKGRSRVEKELLASNRHRRYVPCPHCGEFQILIKGYEAVEGETSRRPGGFRWERDERGRSDPDLAYQTAWYECEHCEGRIENHHRVTMLRAGVWCPDGCTVDRDGQIQGTALKAGSDTMGFGPLPSWYALTETWGDFPRRWLKAQGRPRELQDVVNSYMAETWEVRQSKSTAQQIAGRIGGFHRRGFVPRGATLITITIDRQRADGGFVKWVALAHGDEERSWLIDWGQAKTLEALWLTIIRATWPHEDQGSGLIAAITGIDSGWNTKDTYDFCAKHPGVLPLKGASDDLGGLAYRLNTLKDGIAVKGQELLHVGTDYWETDLQDRLDNKLREEPRSLTLCSEAGNDPEFMAELCNATLEDSTDSRGNTRLLWVKKDENVPNDYRDAIRYGHCLAKYWQEKNASGQRRVFSLPQRR